MQQALVNEVLLSNSTACPAHINHQGQDSWWLTVCKQMMQKSSYSKCDLVAVGIHKASLIYVIFFLPLIMLILVLAFVNVKYKDQFPYVAHNLAQKATSERIILI